jgi:hypothetical protein
VTLTESDLSDLLAALKAGEFTDRIRSSLEWILQQLIEAEATARIGAAPYERTENRLTQRNGHRPRLLATPAGDVELAIPNSERAASSRACSSGAGGSTGPSTRSSWRPTSRGSPPERSTTW